MGVSNEVLDDVEYDDDELAMGLNDYVLAVSVNNRCAYSRSEHRGFNMREFGLGLIA